MPGGDTGDSSRSSRAQSDDLGEMRREMLDLLEDPVAVYQVDTRRMLAANRRARELFGKNDPALQATTLPELIGQGPASTFDQAARRALEEGSASCRWHSHPSDGKPRSIDIRLVRAETRGAVVAVFRDSSPLEEVLQQFAKIAEATPDAVALVRTADDVILDVNSSFESLIGWKRDEAIGKTVHTLNICPNPEARGPVLRTLREEKLRYVEYSVRRKDGTLLDGLLSVRPLDLDGEGVILIILRDVSEQQTARRALEESEARLRALVHATFEGIGFTERGKIIDVNEQLLTMYGMRAEDVIGSDVTLLVAPESRAEVTEKMRSGDEGPYEHLCIRKDGTIFPVEIRARPLHVGDRTLRMTAIRDMTSRKRAELERERLIAELTARNAEMEQFTYTVSHDLKSPLVTISGFLGMLERDLAAGDKERIDKDLARIGSATNKMMRLLTDLLELSRIGRVTHGKTAVPLGDVVRDALELVSGLLTQRRVRVDVADTFPEVHGDRVRLVQVLQNLLENAVKYMGDQAEPAIEIGHRPDTAGTVFFVRDNGIGIDPRHHERIFGLFEKLDPKSEGTGVGLALVRRILEFHGGSIWVESESGGSAFVARLPSGPSHSDTSDTGDTKGASHG